MEIRNLRKPVSHCTEAARFPSFVFLISTLAFLFAGGCGAPGEPTPPTPPVPAAAARAHAASNGAAPAEVPARNARIATSPAIRRRAHEAGIDLQQITGSGPNGRIVPKDLEAYVARRGAGATPLRAAPKAVPGNRAPVAATEEIKVIGLRRLIAQRMSEAKRNIPHFAYVEELDITELDSLRRHLNRKPPAGAAALTYLPFLALGLVRVLKNFPQCNAHYDAERGVIVRHAAVHLGVATQTPEGLKVPVVHDAQNLSLWELAAQMRRVSEAARWRRANPTARPKAGAGAVPKAPSAEMTPRSSIGIERSGG